MISHIRSIDKSLYISIILIFISSQSSPGNKFLVFSIISFILVNLILFLKYIYKNINHSRYVYLILLLILFLTSTLIIQYDNFNIDILKQIIRIIYPWYLIILFLITIKPYQKTIENIFEILSFSSIVLYAIVLPDILSILFGLISNPLSITFLKGQTLIYPESNTTATFLLFNNIFRNELKIANFKENTFILFCLLLTFSRGCLVFFFLYNFYNFSKLFLKKRYTFFVDKFTSRLFPIIGFLGLIFARLTLQLASNTKWELFSLSDSSFKSRLAIVDYIIYFFNNINIHNFHKLFLGFGWLGQNDFAEGVLGTKGHTLIGMIPELGLFYIIFLFVFFYRKAWNGQLAESVLLTLSLTIFIPISYITPILCLSIIKNKFFMLSKQINEI